MRSHMSSNDSFLDKVKEILTQANSDVNDSIWSLADGWESFIAQCKKGYRDNIYEYYNDISIRRKIELLLASSDLQSYPEFNEFSEKVKSLDAEFSELMQKDIKVSGRSYWWEQKVPK